MESNNEQEKTELLAESVGGCYAGGGAKGEKHARQC